jgi:hypothetical protein
MLLPSRFAEGFPPCGLAANVHALKFRFPPVFYYSLSQNNEIQKLAVYFVSTNQIWLFRIFKLEIVSGSYELQIVIIEKMLALKLM